MDALLDEALETLALMFTELVQMARALPKPAPKGPELIERSKVLVAIAAVGAALRRMSPRPKATAAAGVLTPMMSRPGGK